MTHDLVERLRDYGLTLEESVVICDRRVVDEAADRIEKLERENAALRAEKAELRKAVIEEAATIAYVEAVKHCSARDGKTLIGHPVGQAIAAAIRNMGDLK